METGTFTKRSSESSNIEERKPLFDLDLPVDSIRMLPPFLAVNETLRLNRQYLKNFPNSLLSPEERWDRKVHEPFVM